MAQQTYRITHPQTGQVIRMTGPEPPTEAEIRQAFAAVQTGAPAQPAQPKPTAQPAKQDEGGGIMSTLADVGVGAAKGLGNTVIGLGELAQSWIPGVAQASSAIYGRDVSGDYERARAHVQPTNTAQNVGFMAEQVGEFFVPGGAVARAARGSRAARAGLEAATAAPLAAAQGASRMEAGATGALSAAVPGVGAAVRGTRRMMQQGAEKNVAQALGATKEWAKTDAAKLAPEMLRRGVGGSREAMLARATEEVSSVGAQIGKAIEEAAEAGATVDAQALSGFLAGARQSLVVQTANGRTVPIPGTERIVSKLAKLDEFVASLGPDIPFDKAAKIKTTWDRIVSKAGLYGPKATSSATDSADAWAVREAATGFRKLLAEGSATLDDLNKEYAFWKGLKNVLKETEKRTQAQGGGLVSGVAGVAGVSTGLATGNSTGDKVTQALVYGAAGRQLVRLMQSPAWRTKVSGPTKDAIARALARNDVGALTSITARIAATLPSTAR